MSHGPFGYIEPPAPPPPAWPTWVLAALVTVTACATVTVGAPVLGHGLQPVPLAVGTAVTVGLADQQRRAARRQQGRTRWLPAAAGAALVVLYTIGAATTPVVGGAPVLRGSDLAAVSDLLEDAHGDLVALGEYDELVRLSDAEARSRFAAYADAKVELSRVTSRWAAVAPEDLPDPTLAPLAQRMVSTANFAFEAVDARRQLLLTASAEWEQQLEVAHQNFVLTRTETGLLLSDLAAQYGVDVDQVTIDVGE